MSRLGAIVLCGGLSSRMGRPKAWLPFGPERLLERVVRLVGQAADPVVVVAARGQALPPLPDSVLLAVDAHPERGPLEGLRAGLEALPDSVEFAYATATDVPFLVPNWILSLAAWMGQDDVAIADVGGFHHPLAALYRRAVVLPLVRKLLAENRLRPFFLLEACKVRRLTEAELRTVDPDLSTLQNLNSPDDYRRALDQAGLPPGRLEFELHGVPRLRAGFARFVCTGSSLGEAIRALAQAAPKLDGTVILGDRLHPAYKISLNTQTFIEDPHTLLIDGDQLILMTADVGG